MRYKTLAFASFQIAKYRELHCKYQTLFALFFFIKMQFIYSFSKVFKNLDIEVKISLLAYQIN